MKKTIILIIIFNVFSINLFAQNKFENNKLKELNLELKIFISDLETFINQTDTLTNTKPIVPLAKEINIKSKKIIKDIDNIFHISEYDDDATIYFGLASAFNKDFPTLSNLYTYMATDALNSSDIATPKYYNELIKIRDLTSRLKRKKKVKKVKKLLGKIKYSYEKLKSLE